MEITIATKSVYTPQPFHLIQVCTLAVYVFIDYSSVLLPPAKPNGLDYTAHCTLWHMQLPPIATQYVHVLPACNSSNCVRQLDDSGGGGGVQVGWRWCAGGVVVMCVHSKSMPNCLA